MILEVRELVAAYGLSQVLHGVSLEVRSGEVVCLLGRNGAGKTTTLRTIMGLVTPRSGSVRFHDEDVTGWPPWELARRGVAYVPDDRRIFADLTVEENLEIVRRVLSRSGTWTVAQIYELFPALRELRAKRGGALSGGEQKMLAIGRALMGNPTLLMLDEPSEGLSPLMVRALLAALQDIVRQGVTLLVADQNLKFARRLGGRGYILDRGAIRHAGPLEALWRDEDVVRRYLAL